MDAANAHRRLSDKVSLITLKVYPAKGKLPLTALVDTGASNNFIRGGALKRFGIERVENHPRSPPLVIILANGATVEVPKQSVKLCFVCDGITMQQEFIVMDLNTRFDLVLGLPWFRKYKPRINWESLSVVSYEGRKSALPRKARDDRVTNHPVVVNSTDVKHQSTVKQKSRHLL